MKKVYFVRHGESEENAGTLRQGPVSCLSPLGLKQAECVAERFGGIRLDKFFCSTQKRAVQTAEAINKTVGLPIEYSDLLIENKWPSSFFGKLKTDSASLEIETLIKRNFHDLTWHYADEENFADLRSRALAVLKLLEDTEAENILVVTHGLFLRVLAACIIGGPEVTPAEYEKLFFALWYDNTGISEFSFYPWQNEAPRWHIDTWNDHSHLD